MDKVYTVVCGERYGGFTSWAIFKTYDGALKDAQAIMSHKNDWRTVETNRWERGGYYIYIETQPLGE